MNMQTRAKTWGRPWVPWIVLAVALACTGAVSYQLHTNALAQERQVFENSVNQMAAALTDRLNNQITLLQTTAGFFAGSPAPPSGEFRRFVNHLQLEVHYPGVVCLGFASSVPRGSQGNTPSGPANDDGLSFTVTRVAPDGDRRSELAGWNLASDPRIRSVMVRARDTASVAITPELYGTTRAQLDDGHVFAFLPVFDGYTAPESPEERAGRLSGFAFLVLNTDGLLRRAFPYTSRHGYSIALYDAENGGEPLLETHSDNLASQKPRYETRAEIPVPGRAWVLDVKRWPADRLAATFGLGAYAAILGSLVSLLLFGILWIQVAARAASERYAEDHRRSEERLRVLNETLEQRVGERTAEAEQRTAQLRAMALQLTEVEQEERRRLAQILHDDLQQMLVAGRLRIDRVMRSLTNDENKEDLTYADELLAQAIQTARSLSVDLSPPILRERGLAPALDWLARKMQTEHGLTVYQEIEEDAAPDAEEAKHFIIQAVRELLFNVVKHAGVTEAWVSLRVDGPDLEVEVRDNGDGFKPVSEPDDTRPEEHFGLASIRHRIDLFGGESCVDSVPGSGTRVSFRIPRHVGENAGPDTVVTSAPDKTAPPKKAGPEPVISADNAVHHKIRVLLVDDHKIVRQGLAGLLSGESDIELVGEASDGVDALDKVREVHPDVVVMDITMPRMNGIEATRHITVEHPGIRVIGLSMHEKDDMEMAIRAAGAETYLSKDGASTALVDAIRGVAEVAE